MNWFVCFGNDNADGIQKVKYLQRIDWSRLNINPLSFRLFMSANMMEIGKVIGDNKDSAVWSVSLKKLESKMMTQNWMKTGAVLIDGTSLYQGEREVCVTYSINILWIMRNLLVFVLHLIFSALSLCVFLFPPGSHSLPISLPSRSLRPHSTWCCSMVIWFHRTPTHVMRMLDAWWWSGGVAQLRNRPAQLLVVSSA